MVVASVNCFSYRCPRVKDARGDMAAVGTRCDSSDAAIALQENVQTRILVGRLVRCR